jgi:hypothetical protein
VGVCGGGVCVCVWCVSVIARHHSSARLTHDLCQADIITQHMREYAPLYELIHSYLEPAGMNGCLYDATAPVDPSQSIGKRRLKPDQKLEHDRMAKLEAQLEEGAVQDQKMGQLMQTLIDKVIAPQAALPPPPTVVKSTIALQMEAAAHGWVSFKEWLVAIGSRDLFVAQINAEMTEYLQSDGGPAKDEMCFADAAALAEAMPSIKAPVIKRMALGLSYLRTHLGIDMNAC